MPKNTGLLRIIKAFGYSLAGLKSAFRDEAAFRQVFGLLILSQILSYFICETWTEWIIVLIVHFLSLVVELLNSGLENLADRVSTEIHPLTKKAKDMGSAAQLVMQSLIAILWISLLIKNFIL